MKINEMELRSGITKKNIRFYEEQGLLSPRRDASNGYRDYGEEELSALLRIKLLRKLGVPIGEIRLLQDGTHTVGDVMRRHLVSLEREQRSLEQAAALCRELQSFDAPASELDAQAMLRRMEELERGGAVFSDGQKRDVRVRFVAPIVIAAIFVALMAAVIALTLWAYAAAPEDAPPLWILLVVVGVCAAVAVGVVLAMLQRLREILKGELEDARNY
jgi:DNA-binding transcriptional MerR regulator